MRVRSLFPSTALVLALVLWEGLTRALEISPFILPAPTAILAALRQNGLSLAASGLVTFYITLSALALAVATGLVLAFCFSVSKILEATFYPFAVALQVTPIVSLAPLILIWTGIDGINTALVIIAWIAAFFPLLTTLSAGIKAVDPLLSDLFTLYGASKLQRFLKLTLPSLMPFFFSGLKVSAGLALVGAVVAEFVAGSGGATGLAWRIVEAGHRLETATMMAGLVLLSAIGLVQFYLISAIEAIVLKGRRARDG